MAQSPITVCFPELTAAKLPQEYHIALGLSRLSHKMALFLTNADALNGNLTQVILRGLTGGNKW